MPNTKSAERRARGNETKRLRNRSVKSHLKTIEKDYAGLLKAGKKDEATTAYRELSSALDKAVKAGVVVKATASRKRSRLAIALGKLK